MITLLKEEQACLGKIGCNLTQPGAFQSHSNERKRKYHAVLCLCHNHIAPREGSPNNRKPLRSTYNIARDHRIDQRAEDLHRPRIHNRIALPDMEGPQAGDVEHGKARDERHSKGCVNLPKKNA